MDKTVSQGDKIIALNQKVTIGNVLFQHVYIDPDKPEYSNADIEFHDDKGNYRHYQSWNDGGKIVWADGFEYEFIKERSNWL